ncbi:uroporphyrinogen-III C-methyltransferase [Pseudomonas kuykendallii]|uniref:Uroporphyrin-3 C-methyltransferase n=1 Tax=Pseudomonas kuykendallii TaxID=1007099 RepID=A0A1H2RWH9_9PSED|nr:uroporphyrinogen-III C-methyltransferase [Pseudomonas kuykendallii]MCQ4270356.1 uroporphyrinogen-III C-methyltransferase [Pseudomonas kuykendallii]SDW23833.1 uroporphyrin-3 C-methyltransferase [Pseudomonas kuykendallii]
MSETDAKIAEAQDPVTPVEVAAEPRRPGNGVAVLALLVGIAALAIGGWASWQSHTQQQLEQRRQAEQASLAKQVDERLQQNGQQVEARLQGLPSAQSIDEQRRLLVTLQGDQQQLAKTMTSVLGASRESWRLAEAEHLLRLAILRLTALQDIASATALVQGADDILRAQDDPLAFAARGELIKALETLRALPQPDRNGLFLQLSALRSQADQLQTLAPEYEIDETGAAPAPTQAPWWQRTWDKLSKYVRLELHADQDIRPQLAGQSLAQVRLTLSLALEQAQWAALNAQPEIYRAALTQAQELLKTYFDAQSHEVGALASRLAQLAEQPVSVEIPDLRPALLSLQAYLKEREAPRQDKPAADEAEQPADAVEAGE